MVTDSPTPPRMTVDFSNTGVDTDGDRELTDVGTESRPEAIEGTGLVDRANMDRGPVANWVPVHTEEYQAGHDDEPRRYCRGLLRGWTCNDCGKTHRTRFS